MQDTDREIRSLLGLMTPITLDEMRHIKLMNRLDTKYVTSRSKLVELLGLLRDEYYVQETASLRVSPYQTTYYDTRDHKFYLAHHAGCANRMKVRTRSYVAVGLSFLEVKRKNNHARTKKSRVEIPSHDSFRHMAEAAALIEAKAGVNVDALTATVGNRFNRITLVNCAKTERLTIDIDVRFHNFETGRDYDAGDLVIIELKRDGYVFSPATAKLREIRVHPTGFSKCCIGMAVTDPNLKQNNFKPKIRMLERINRGTQVGTHALPASPCAGRSPHPRSLSGRLG